MACPMRGDLHRYLDGEMDPRDQTEFQEHLSGCADCASHLGQVEGVESRLRAISWLATPAGLTDRVLAGLPQSERRFPASRAWRFASAAAVVLLVALALASQQDHGLLASGRDSGGSAWLSDALRGLRYALVSLWHHIIGH